jgi:nucleolin
VQSGGNGGNAHLTGVASTLFVGNLSFNTTEQTLQAAFTKYGGIVSCRVAKDQEGSSRGFGHIDYDTPANAAAALVMAGSTVDGR